jgi:hypothetical protein
MGRAQALQAFDAVQTGDASKPRIFCAHDQYPKKPARIIGRADVWGSCLLQVFGLKNRIFSLKLFPCGSEFIRERTVQPTSMHRLENLSRMNSLPQAVFSAPTNRQAPSYQRETDYIFFGIELQPLSDAKALAG